MASNDNRPSVRRNRAAAGADRSRRTSSRAQRRSVAGASSAPSARTGGFRVSKGSAAGSAAISADRPSRKNKRNTPLIVLAVAAVLTLVAVIGAAVLYWSDTFPVTALDVKGVEHLTDQEVAALASVPEGSTLTRIDTEAIESRLLKDAWVQEAHVNRVFPNTLEIVVTERQIAAVVEVPTADAQATRPWAIASDGMWLMPIPERDSDAGKATSPKVFEDADAALKITDVPFGTQAEIGQYCTDGNVNNALDIVSGMTTELAGQVKTVSATDAESTTLTLENGVEIAFGTADDIRDKERVCLELMKQYEGQIAYINVRSVSRPTWRSL